MKSSCPKCSALLSEDLPSVPEKGRNGKCSECGTPYWIHRESFILRCYTVSGERYCSKCGEALGQSTYCPGCGTLYPDYCVVHSKKPAQRAFEKKHYSLNLSLPSFAGKSAASVQKPGLMSTGGGTGASDLKRQLLMVGAGLALVAVIAVLALLYIRDRAENRFANKFVVALYGVKSGTDQCLKKSALLASGSRLIDNDLAQLKSVRAEIAASLQVLSPPPEKFSDAHVRLMNLAATYEKLYSLCITSGPAGTVAPSAGALERQFYSQAKELKGVLPPKLLSELTTKASRYTNLQFMLE